MDIIGLSGFARAGKDTVASIMKSDYGYEPIAFADKLRESLFALNPVVVSSNGSEYSRLQDVLEKFGGWDGYKDSEYSIDIRTLLQRLGTEAGRNIVGDNVWINATMGSLDMKSNYVITDARFINEFDAITNHGGSIWRIERPGTMPANDHASEMQALRYKKFEQIVYNHGHVADLHEIVREAMIYHKERIGE